MKKSVKANIVSATLAASLLLSATGAFAFTDVDTNHWAANDIAKLSGSGYINGYEDGSFKPGEFITRAEFVTIINKVKGVSARSYKTYPDVSADAWYADQIDIASTAGFITGYDDGTIRPDAAISRAEVAVVCYKAWNLSPEGQIFFADSNEIGSWAQTQIATLVAKNVLSGYEDGTFKPGNAITRAEVAKIVSRMTDLSQASITTVTNPVVPGTAGLSNTSVVIKSGSNGSSSGSGSSNSGTTLQSALKNVVKGKSVKDYLKTIINNSSSSKTANESTYVSLYDTAVKKLIDNMDEYEKYTLSNSTDSKRISNDITAVVAAINSIASGFIDECKAGFAAGATAKDILDEIVKDNKSAWEKISYNDTEVTDAVEDFVNDISKKITAENIADISGKKLSKSDVANIFKGDYSYNAKEPTADEKKELDKLIPTGSSNKPAIEDAKPEEVKETIETVISYIGKEDEVKIDDDITDIYQDAIVELVKSNDTDYSTNSGNAATKLAEDVATVVLATNESIDKVVELAKDGKLNKDSLVEYRTQLESLVNQNASADNKEAIKDIMNDKAVDMYAALQDDFASLNQETNEEAIKAKVLELYNQYKNGNNN